MAVPASQRRLIQHTFGQNLPESHHHGQIGVELSELLLAGFVLFDAFGGENR